ncbi:MAG: hypothetical protein LKE46_03195 [Clostridium sp.]|uniref:hypothetical protein n=1 Tax=Clostridium sp. TaxID=1506 RepID=UPI0025B8CEAA|nr:hypothetical protein [Clostridium sp.]MCH3963255.1 hypothetical protein [Clostridium sp.]MCI1717227.1 hypothetical protein [Clostridium sp.]MCI1801567.1 hypothetical protein [Clostridium sp.]MCI1815413.1 hypothetical protein [Clostridium sp.]MCI1872316.1 hypothetical protein [Clostridium sp.]
MRIIKTLRDIELLKKKSQINRKVLQEIEEYFNNVYSNIGKPEGKTIDEFSLKDCGIIVYIEDGDNVWDLEQIGLNPGDNGLLGAVPEWIDEQPIGEDKLESRCIVCNNEYVLSIFLLKNNMDNEVKNWIEDNR